MKLLNSILVVNLIFLVTINQTINAKCVMSGLCSPHKQITSNQDPLLTKWNTCQDDGEARPLYNQKAINDFKKLCPSMYTDDQQPLCCNSEQLSILNKDLLAAQALLGSCSSCFFNFRQLWCHYTCNPDQDSFMTARSLVQIAKTNFTEKLAAFKNRKHSGDYNSYDGDDGADYGNEGDDYEYNEKEKHDESKHHAKAEVPFHAQQVHNESSIENEKNLVSDRTDESGHNIETDDYDYENYEKSDKTKRSANSENSRRIKRIKKRSFSSDLGQTKVSIVTSVNFYIDRTFMNELANSCRGIKLYGDDAITGICGVNAKECDGQHIGNFLGLKTDMRPMDIYFNLFDGPKTLQQDNKVYEIAPIKPVYHMCNESYKYGDLEYGAKCSCKDCQSSCQLYDELRIFKKQIFMIGELDGASVIMAIIWLLFLIPFLKSVSLFSNIRARFWKKKSTGLNCHVYANQSQTPKAQNATEDLENNLIASDQADFTLSPLSVEEYELTKRRRKRVHFLDKMKYVGGLLEKFIEENFTRMGRFCARYPGLVLFIGIGFCSILCLGYINFKIENDPVKLWSADSSVARQNKKYFDEHFGPFYRITQLIIEPKESKIAATSYGGQLLNTTAFNAQVLNETLSLYMKINSLHALCKDCEDNQNKKIKLRDICFQPLEPDNLNCATQSVFQYWQNDETRIRESLSDGSFLYHLDSCMRNPYLPDCLAAFGGPLQPYMIAGSYENNDYLAAKSLIMTFVINNHIKAKKPEEIKRAMAWEYEVLQLLKDYSSPLINVIYTTERSIEDELERESKADMKIIGISYIVMFFYLTITLGKYSSMNIRVILIEMKFFLAMSGVVLVILSVLSSGGFFMYLGVPATLITLEVIPFLLLAVGIDNIYVMVQTYQNDEKPHTETVEDQIARIVGKVGPSMLLTGTTQASAFLISSMTPMPGVRAFSLYASLAIVLNFILQITCFVALLTLDAKREKAKRIDMLCCIKCRNLDDAEIKNGKKSFLFIWFKEIYTPFLLNNYVRAFVIVVFVGFFFACIAMCDKIKIGLDQKLTMSRDSYQTKYFAALQTHLKVGPPVYFIVKDGYNYTDVSKLRRLCGASNCDVNSLQSIISSASFFPEETYIAQSTVNWIDDYVEWLNADPIADTSSTCCHVDLGQDLFCDIKKLESQKHKLPSKDHSLKHCQPCPVSRTVYQFPENDVILKYIGPYLKQNPSSTCIKAGHAMYGAAVNLKHDENTNKVSGIGSSHFMAYHTVLSSSNDFINAMVSANQISKTITDILNKDNNGSATDTHYEVIPYSIFYVFYEQYLKIWQDATAQLVTTLISIFICIFVLLSFDLFTALIVTVVVAIIIIDMVGIMFIWDIELNAISLVNLVIAIGISVEFSAHIGRAFATSNGKTKKKRAADALCNMGPPVFSGVVQSIVGISVLAFAHSQLFQVFYFRMYFSILILGLTHGLIFLPVLLSYIGRSSNHLAYFKVNFDKNSQSTESYDKNQELKEQSNHQDDDKDFQTVTIERQEIISKPISSPKEKFQKKYYAKINNQRVVRDSSPISRKSVDCLLEQHENESNSSNENNYVNLEKETNIDSVDIDENNNEYEQSSHKGSFASALNSLRHKFNGQFKEIRKSRSRLASNNDFPDIENRELDTSKINGASNEVGMLSSSEIEETITSDKRKCDFEPAETDRNVPNDTISDISTPNISMSSEKRSESFLKKLNESANSNPNPDMLSKSFNLKEKGSKEVKTNKSLINLMTNGKKKISN